MSGEISLFGEDLDRSDGTVRRSLVVSFLRTDTREGGEEGGGLVGDRRRTRGVGTTPWREGERQTLISFDGKLLLVED